MSLQFISSRVQQLKQDIFAAAEYGKPAEIEYLLTGLNLDLIKQVLHYHTERGNRRETPLTIAAQRGHLKVVQLLVEHFHVQCDQKTSSKREVDNQNTALMHAAYRGYLDIVKCLVNNGSDLNLRNQSGQTPLFFACIGNHYEVVKYLVESGAHTEDVNAAGDSCLTVACSTGNEQILRYLVGKGADVNWKNRSGWTPLHMAAIKNSPEVVEFLLKNGARVCKDRDGLSPLMVAAKCRRADVVHWFVKSSYATRKEKIDALELLGAQVANRDLNKSFRYLRQAMVERHRDPAVIIAKPHSPLPTLSGAVESRTVEELEARQFDQDILRLECLAILQRIIGCKNNSLFFYFFDYFMELKSVKRYSKALSILLYAVKNAQYFHRGCDLGGLNYFLSGFRGMLKYRQCPCFSTVLEVLGLALTEIQHNNSRQPMLKDKLVNVCLQCIVVGLKVAQGQEERRLLKEKTECLIHLRPSLSRGQSILHKAVAGCRDQSWVLYSVQDLPFDLLASFLIQCGADVNAMDDQRNRPLHEIAQWFVKEADSDVLCRIGRILLQAGALVGVRNSEGKTPLRVAATEAVAAILREHCPVSLKSLAASAVVRHQIPYAGKLLADLEEFVQRH